MFSLSQRKRLVFFAVLAVLSYLMWQLSAKKTDQVSPQAFTKGYAASGISGKNSDSSGEFVVRYQADELVEYAHSDQVQFTQPKVWTRHQGHDQWYFRSVQAVFDQSQEIMHFRQQVQAENLPAKADERVRLRTETLSLNPSSRQAYAQERVTLDCDGVEATAIGAEFDLRNNRHRLLSEVKLAYHERPEQSPDVKPQPNNSP